MMMRLSRQARYKCLRKLVNGFFSTASNVTITTVMLSRGDAMLHGRQDMAIWLQRLIMSAYSARIGITTIVTPFGMTMTGTINSIDLPLPISITTTIELSPFFMIL